MSFKENLRYYREKAGYTTAKGFAAKLKIPYSTYAGYEVEDREPTFKTLCDIADLLDISIDELLGRDEKYIKYTVPKTDDDKLKIMLNNLLRTRERNVQIQVANIDKNFVNLIFTGDEYRVPVSITKKSILDAIDFTNKAADKIKGAMFMRKLEDTFVDIFNDYRNGENKAIERGVPFTAFLDLFNDFVIRFFVPEYEYHKKRFPKMKLIFHEPIKEK